MGITMFEDGRSRHYSYLLKRINGGFSLKLLQLFEFGATSTVFELYSPSLNKN